MRVFIGVTEIAGMYRNLKQGFRQLGIPATFINYYAHPFQYGGDDNPVLLKLLKNLWVKEQELMRAKKTKKTARLVRWKNRVQWLFFWSMALTHDVFIFGFGTSMLPNYQDLPILKKLGKKIIFQSNGSDSRPPFIDGAVLNQYPDIETALPPCMAMTKERKKNIVTIDQYADLVVDIPPQGLFRQKPFINWLKLGISLKPNHCLTRAEESHAQVKARLESRNYPETITILHCPSDPKCKGSNEIQAAIDSLKTQGYAIHYVTIVGQPNEVVMKALVECDLVIDQLYADYGMPGFATEAAWFAKPVLIGGYGKPVWDELLAPEETPPTSYCAPSDFDTALKRLLEDHEFRMGLGLKARAFVENQWSPQNVMNRYLQLIQGNIPESWWCDPKDTRYYLGFGMPTSQVRDTFKAILEQEGPEGFQLQDKPILLQEIIRFVGEASPPSPAEASVDATVCH